MQRLAQFMRKRRDSSVIHRLENTSAVLVVTVSKSIAETFQTIVVPSNLTFCVVSDFADVSSEEYNENSSAYDVVLVDAALMPIALKRSCKHVVLAVVTKRALSDLPYGAVDVITLPADLPAVGFRIRNLIELSQFRKAADAKETDAPAAQDPSPAARAQAGGRSHSYTNSMMRPTRSRPPPPPPSTFGGESGVQILESPLQHALRVLRDSVSSQTVSIDAIRDVTHLLEDLSFESLNTLPNYYMSNSATNMDSQTRDWLLSQLSVMDSSSKDKSLASSAMQLEPERIVQLLDEVEVSHRERLLTILCEWTFDPVLHASSEIMDLCVAMFVHFNLLERYKVDERVMRSFLANIAKEYNSDIPYHNFTHAVDAAQFLFLQLEVGGAAQFLNYQDIFALLIAALAHDVGHNGRNNQFHIGQRSELAILYNDTSVLESFHASTMFRVMLSSPENNILANLKPEEFNNVRSKIISSILATDMTHHFGMIDMLTARVNRLAENSFQKDTKEDRKRQQQSKEDRRMLIRMLMHMSDISNPCRPMLVAESWARRLQEEFFLQGDEERALSRPVSAFMDRNAPNLPQLQINFIDFIVRPLLDLVARIVPEMSVAFGSLAANREKWVEAQTQANSAANAAKSS